MLLSLDSPNMTSEVPSSISLTLSSFSQKSHTAFTLAEAFHSDFLRCTDEAQRRRVCCDYRDKILDISKFTDILAAAFNDAFPQSLRDSTTERHKKAWTEFTGLVQRQKKSQSREAQRLQHQTCVVSIWGKAIFEHYGWHRLPLDSIRLLHSVACTLRQWGSAVELMNEALLDRHERRVAQNQNRSNLIGEHPFRSKIQDRRSPVERQDIQAVLTRLKSSDLPEYPRADQSEDRVYTIGGTPIRNYGLERDDFGMIVPHGAPGVVPESPSPTIQASKRRKIAKASCDTSGRSEDLPMALLSQQCSSTPAYTTGSEMTDFEEDSSDDLTSVESDRGIPNLTSNDLPQDDRNNIEILTSDMSADVSVSAFRRMKRPHVNQSVREDTPQVSDAGSLEWDYRMSEDLDRDRDLGPPLEIDMSVGLQEEGHDGDDETATSDSRSTRHERSPRSSRRESSPLGAGGMFDSGHQSSSSDIHESQKHFSLSQNVEKSFCSTSLRSSLVAIVEFQDSRLNIMDVSGSPLLHPPDLNTDVQTLRDEIAEEETRTEVETGDELHRPINITVSKSITPIDNQVEPDYDRVVQGTDPDQAITRDILPDSETYSLPTPIGRFIPASAYQPLNRHCTDTTVENDGTIMGRMASCYAGQLRNELDAAREHCKCKHRSTRTHNELKVKWLENTRWANVYDVPVNTNPALALPLKADVWYMQWDTFRKRADAGETFSRPVVIKQKFQDSGMYELQDYLALLKERYPHQALDVQDSDTGRCLNMKIQDFWAATSGNDSSPGKLAGMSNAINLRKIANADAPLLTRLKRFRLLETLLDRASSLMPGKRSYRDADDISDCLGFDLLGFRGAFTRPHVDALIGTWIRCLFGTKAWIFAPNMSEEDWYDFTQEGPSWSPTEKGRVIVLEKDDVLLMPPGVRTLHTVFTLEPSLMEGGMLWDECNIPSLLDELLWVSQNQICTNEAIAYQLPSIVDALEGWLHENLSQSSAVESIPDYVACVQRGIRSLRELGCKCANRCVSSRCQCIVQSRRCTAWCLKHPALPGSVNGRDHDCMTE
jgi:hypothetical protein